MWKPKFIASPGGLILPRVLFDISTLIGGGLRGIFLKGDRE